VEGLHGREQGPEHHGVGACDISFRRDVLLYMSPRVSAMTGPIHGGKRRRRRAAAVASTVDGDAARRRSSPRAVPGPWRNRAGRPPPLRWALDADAGGVLRKNCRAGSVGWRWRYRDEPDNSLLDSVF